MLERLISDPWTKLLSVIIAVATWLYVQGAEVRDDRLPVQIAWTLPDDLVATEPLPTAGWLLVRGTGAALRQARETPLRLVVDAERLDDGDHAVELGPLAVEGLPGSLERLETQPPSVSFTLDQVAVRSLKVVPVVVGEPPQGYGLGPVAVSPKVTEVRGPRELVSALREVSTGPIDVSGLTTDAVRRIALDLPRGVEPSTPDLVVQAEISVISLLERRRIEDVPVVVWRGAGWSTEPDLVAVIVEGPVAAVGALTPADLAAVVYLPEGVTQRSEVWFGPEAGARLGVLLPGEGGVKAVATSPPSVVAVGP